MILDPIRRMLRELGLAYGGAAVISIFVNLALLIVPLYTLILYDRILSSRNMDTLTALSIGCIGGMVLYGILEFLRSSLFLVMGDRVARRLNLPTLQAAIARTLDGQGSSAAQAMRDLNELRGFVTGAAAAIPLDLLWSPVLVFVLFLLHPLYGWFGLGCAGLLFGISLATDLVTREPLSAAATAANSSVNDLAAVLRNGDLLDGMGMLPAVARRWQSRLDRTNATLDRASRHARAFGAVAKTLRLLMQGGIISLGVVLVIRNQATPGSLMAANLIVAKLLQPFEQLVGGWRQWMFALAALRRVRAVLSHRSTRLGALVADGCGSVVIDGVSFTPPGRDRPVLEDISLTIAPGEVLAIVGPSAAGKSTLARLIVGLFPPTHGAVRVDGLDSTAWDRAAFGRVVGYVPQSVALLDGTIFDNIARMDEADPARVGEAATLARVHEMIGRLPLGYATWVGGNGYSLSGGQRQRVALARAVFGGPRLVVLDEPNANLDQAGEEDLAQAILALKSRGIGVVVVTHRPALLAVVDTLLVLKHGRIQHHGTRADVLPRLTDAAPAPVPALAANCQQY